MRLRDNIRRLRLYYKSLPLIFHALELPLAALALPLMHGKARFRSKTGLALERPVEILRSRAYLVEVVPCGDKVGYIYAKRAAA